MGALHEGGSSHGEASGVACIATPPLHRASPTPCSASLARLHGMPAGGSMADAVSAPPTAELAALSCLGDS